MKYGASWVFILLLLFAFIIPVWADIQIAEVTNVKFEGIGDNASITIEGSIKSDQTGVGYLEALITFEGKDYRTQVVEIQSRIPEQNYRHSFRLDDFRYIDHQKNQVEILPNFQPGQTILVYIYQQKITTGENLTVDTQNEINQRSYALRGILAKKTFKLPE